MSVVVLEGGRSQGLLRGYSRTRHLLLVSILVGHVAVHVLLRSLQRCHLLVRDTQMVLSAVLHGYHARMLRLRHYAIAVLLGNLGGHRSLHVALHFGTRRRRSIHHIATLKVDGCSANLLALGAAQVRSRLVISQLVLMILGSEVV